MAVFFSSLRLVGSALFSCCTTVQILVVIVLVSQWLLLVLPNRADVIFEILLLC